MNFEFSTPSPSTPKNSSAKTLVPPGAPIKMLLEDQKHIWQNNVNDIFNNLFDKNWVAENFLNKEESIYTRELRFVIDQDKRFLSFLQKYVLELIMDVYQYEAVDQAKLFQILDRKIPGKKTENVQLLKRAIILFFYNYIFESKDIIIEFVEKATKKTDQVFMHVCLFCTESIVHDFIGQMLWHEYDDDANFSKEELKNINKW